MIVAPLREVPGTIASACAKPMTTRVNDTHAAYGSVAPPHAVGVPHHNSDQHQHRADDERIAQGRLRMLLEQQPEYTDRQRSQGEQP